MILKLAPWGFWKPKRSTELSQRFINKWANVAEVFQQNFGTESRCQSFAVLHLWQGLLWYAFNALPLYVWHCRWGYNSRFCLVQFNLDFGEAVLLWIYSNEVDTHSFADTRPETMIGNPWYLQRKYGFIEDYLNAAHVDGSWRQQFVSVASQQRLQMLVFFLKLCTCK